MKFPKVITAISKGKYNIHLSFEDGVEGIVDLSDMAGKGIFTAWDKDDNFNKVFIEKESGAIAWPGNLDIDTLNCYIQIKEMTYS
ncbi:MAG: DUF2442 domain-containing protein [Chitinophagaceae bacterium]